MTGEDLKGDGVTGEGETENPSREERVGDFQRDRVPNRGSGEEKSQKYSYG